MIHAELTGDSRAELRLLVKAPPADTIPSNVDKAPDLLFSALRGRLRDLLPTLETSPPAKPPAAAPSAISVIDRLRNPLYNMFGQDPAFPAA